MDPAVKRLAIKVGDHDLEEHLAYEDDHKVVWDTGLYEPAADPGPALDEGHLRFVLAGHRLRRRLRAAAHRHGLAAAQDRRRVRRAGAGLGARRAGLGAQRPEAGPDG